MSNTWKICSEDTQSEIGNMKVDSSYNENPILSADNWCEKKLRKNVFCEWKTGLYPLTVWRLLFKDWKMKWKKVLLYSSINHK